jgi:hypothetical protein
MFNRVNHRTKLAMASSSQTLQLPESKGGDLNSKNGDIYLRPELL